MSGPERDILVELAALPLVQRERLMRKLPVGARAELAWRWHGFELDGQREPGESRRRSSASASRPG